MIFIFKLYIIYIVSCYINYSVCYGKISKKNPCSDINFCGECINTNQKCAWCQNENYEPNGTHRCDFAPNLIKHGCKEWDVVNPENSLQILNYKPLNHVGSLGEIVQIAPQTLRVEMRPKTSLTFKLQYRQVEDYPLDIYYLMDFSNSLEGYREKLSSLGYLLAFGVGNLTSNSRLGFGSFVDGAITHESGQDSGENKDPRDLTDDQSRAASFEHHMDLSDAVMFARGIRNVVVPKTFGEALPSTQDGPKGSLNALMQILVCKGEMGWRSKAKKLIILVTPRNISLAGHATADGLSNDDRCHLDSLGTYTLSSNQNSPTMSQVIKKAQENSVHIVFATTGKHLPIYKSFKKILKDSTTIGKLATNSSNIIKLVRDHYNKIRYKVELKDTAPDNMKITYASPCLGRVNKKTQICKGLKVGDTVTFNVTLSLRSCLGQKLSNLKIYPLGVPEELSVEMKALCDCQ